MFKMPFAEYHADMWTWVDLVEYGKPAPAFFAIWPRGSGKSTGAEVVPIELGAAKKRRYCWYVRETQDQSDKSVGNINAVLESPEVERHYPDMSERALTKYGKPKAWRRERLATANGFLVDGLGLDSAIRGVKDVEQRPDLIIFDDIDGRHDTPRTTQKKIETITQSIIPAGSKDVIVLFIQNLLLSDGVMAQIIDGRAEFLLERVVSGPHPAVRNLAYEVGQDGKYRVVGGQPTWPDGQGLDVVERQINMWGLTAFLREAQHEVENTGGMYDHVEFRYCDYDKVPDMVRFALWIDPAVTSTDNSDSMGIQLDGIDATGTIYRFYSWESITSPEDVIKRAIYKALEYGVLYIGVETDQGGDTWRTVFSWVLNTVKAELVDEVVAVLSDEYPADALEEIRKEYELLAESYVDLPSFRQDKAGAGYGSKVHRGQQMLADYERGMIVHVIGTHGALEKSLRRFPNKPLDLADAAFWSWNDLRNMPSASSLYAFI